MRPGSLSIILFISVLFAFGPLSNDMYVPVMPSVRNTFDVPIPIAQLTFSMFLFGFAIGQLLMGPLSDRLGRKPILTWSLAIFSLSCLVCGLATDINWLIFGRLLQALATSSTWVVSRAIIRDVHDGEQTTKIFGYCTSIMGGIAAFMPITGGFLSEGPGWRMMFFLLALFGGISLLFVLVYFRETAPIKVKTKQTPQLFRSLKILLFSPIFMGYTVCLCLSLGAMMTFISGGSFIFILMQGIPPKVFGATFILVAPTFSLGAFLSARLTKFYSNKYLFDFGLYCTAGGCILMNIMLSIGQPSLTVLILPLSILALGIGFVMPLSFSGAVKPHPDFAGTASSLIGFCQAAFSALIGLIVTVFIQEDALPMSLQMTTLAVSSVIFYFLVLRPHLDKNPGA